MESQCQRLTHGWAWGVCDRYPVRALADGTMLAKTRATFCLEPPGFGDERKAVADAITLGCIPVYDAAATTRALRLCCTPL